MYKSRASQLSREKGFTATSMYDIADTIGIGTSNLCDQIGSGKKNLKDTCFRAGRRFVSNLREVERTSESYLPKIERIIRFYIRKTDDMKVYVLPITNPAANYRLRLPAILQRNQK